MHQSVLIICCTFQCKGNQLRYFCAVTHTNEDCPLCFIVLFVLFGHPNHNVFKIVRKCCHLAKVAVPLFFQKNTDMHFSIKQSLLLHVVCT